MKQQIKAALVLVAIPLAYVLCAGGALFRYVHTHPGGFVPRWISVPMLCGLIVALGLETIVLKRVAKKRAIAETPKDGHLRRVRAIKGLKMGLVLWAAILLNDIRMLLQDTVPWAYAIPGLIVVTLMTAVTWTSLRRLQRIEAANSEPRQKQSAQ
jgi:Na+/H+ antiporter NhaD/arsenite permease-like protein